MKANFYLLVFGLKVEREEKDLKLLMFGNREGSCRTEWTRLSLKTKKKKHLCCSKQTEFLLRASDFAADAGVTTQFKAFSV